jgi:DNA helicase II / ATP-dependent DNA helicase PcrA
MTRARERLYLTCCRRRRIAGRYQDQAQSPFLAELPGELLEVSQSPALFDAPRLDARAQGIYSFFGGRQEGGRPQRPGEDGEAPSALSVPSRAGRVDRLPVRGRGQPAQRSLVLDPEAAGEPAAPRRPLRRGSRVRHPTLGHGVVLELEGQGEDAKITVFFDKTGKRKLIARFANLEML